MREQNKRRFAKRSLGQNFLVDQSIIQKIVESVPTESEVIEIGPGRGALTSKLIERSTRFAAIEKDTPLAGILQNEFANTEGVEIFEADILGFPIESLLDGFETKPYVVANLPYNISTPVLRRLAGVSDRLSGAVLMLQKEVVERICAGPGERERGFLTVLLEVNFSSRRLFDVPPRAFKPSPKVTSSVMFLSPVPVTKKPKGFERIISKSFAQKRKKLLNNLRDEVSPSEFRLWASKEGIDENARPAELSLDKWISLAEMIACRDASSA